MVRLVVTPRHGDDEESPLFASNNTKYQEYLDCLGQRYSLADVEYAAIIEGSDEVRKGIFDKTSTQSRKITNFHQFLKVARNKQF